MASPHEELGGSPINPIRLSLFSDLIIDCNLIHMGFTGPKFTGMDRRANGSIILECLDRSVHNLAEYDLFPNAIILHLPRVRSDHAPILTDLFHSVPSPTIKCFRFKTIWLSHPSFPTIVSLLGIKPVL